MVERPGDVCGVRHNITKSSGDGFGVVWIGIEERKTALTLELRRGDIVADNGERPWFS